MLLSQYAYNIGPGRWQSLNVRTKNQNKGRRRRKPKATAANGHASEDSDSDGEASDQEDAPEESREGDSATKSEPVVNGSGAKPEPPIDLSRPVERYNAMLAVSGKHLFLYGGILERASMEATLDDFWTLDLSKLDKWTCLKQSEVLWSGVENDSDVDDDAEGEDLSESSSDDDEESDEGQEDIYEEEFVDETAARRQDKMSDAAMVRSMEAFTDHR